MRIESSPRTLPHGGNSALVQHSKANMKKGHSYLKMYIGVHQAPAFPAVGNHFNQFTHQVRTPQRKKQNTNFQRLVTFDMGKFLKQTMDSIIPIRTLLLPPETIK